MSFLRRCSDTASLFLIVLLATACAGSSQALRDEAAQYVYSEPLEQIWPKVEGFMTDEGYTFRSAPGKYALRTEWRENGTSGATRTLISYLVQGERHPSGGCVLRVLRGIKADPNSPSGDPSAAPNVTQVTTFATIDNWENLAQKEVSQSSQRAIYAPMRDVDMELALMRKLDPGAVKQFETQNASAAR